jgi:OmpA-OmpF porin, OOP family
MRRIVSLGVLALAAAANVAVAEDAQTIMTLPPRANPDGFYLGADLGFGRFPGSATIGVNDVVLQATDARRTAFAWNVSAGYRFNRYFAVELGYVDLGEGKARLIDPLAANGMGDLSFSARGFTTAVVGSIPFGKRWDAYARLGLLHPDVELTVSGVADGSPFAARLLDHEVRAFWAVGVGYQVKEDMRVKFELSHYEGVGDNENTGRADILAVTMGFEYRW